VVDVCDFDQKKYTFYYNVFEKDWSIMPVNRLLCTHYYFSAEKVARRFISEFGVEFVRVFYGLVIGGDTDV
jgi:hypothetical protein